MSKVSKEKIVCTYCQTEGEFEFWESVNVDLDPAMREKIFNEEIFIWTCPNCGQRFFIPYSTLYHDMKNNFMIMYCPERAEESLKEISEVYKSLSISQKYTLRIVYGVDELKEKILILEQHLNDIAIEKLKYHILQYELPQEDIHLFFAHILTDAPEYEYGVMRFYCQDVHGEISKYLPIPMEKYFEQCLALELDNRFAAEGIVCVDNAWIAKQMKGA